MQCLMTTKVTAEEFFTSPPFSFISGDEAGQEEGVATGIGGGPVEGGEVGGGKPADGVMLQASGTAGVGIKVADADGHEQDEVEIFMLQLRQ